MRKKRPFLLFWLAGFFLLLILSAAVSGKMTADLAQKNTEEIVASKESVDKFKKEFKTYWWEDYKITANYEKGELEIYLPKTKEENQFINIDDVLSAISLRQYQYKDKHLTVLVLSNSGEKLARLKNGKVIKRFSEKVDAKVVASRLADWKKTNEKVKKNTEKTQSSNPADADPEKPGALSSDTSGENDPVGTNLNDYDTSTQNQGFDPQQ